MEKDPVNMQQCLSGGHVGICLIIQPPLLPTPPPLLTASILPAVLFLFYPQNSTSLLQLETQAGWQAVTLHNTDDW